MRFVQHIILPTIVTRPGRYVTRCGEVVTVERITTGLHASAYGYYSNGIEERWDACGRLLPHSLSKNDIVQSAT